MKYDIAISIGEYCFWAHYLKSKSMRTEAYPFDWMFTNLKFIEECIKEDCMPIIECMNISKSYSLRKYNHRITSASMPHHEMTDQNKAHYSRAIGRWMNALNSEKRVLFLYTSYDGSSQEKNLMVNLNATLKAKYPALNFGLLNLVFEYNKSVHRALYRVTHTDNIYYVTVSMDKLITPETWMLTYQSDALDEIFDKIYGGNL